MKNSSLSHMVLLPRVSYWWLIMKTETCNLVSVLFVEPAVGIGSTLG